MNLVCFSCDLVQVNYHHIGIFYDVLEIIKLCSHMQPTQTPQYPPWCPLWYLRYPRIPQPTILTSLPRVCINTWPFYIPFRQLNFQSKTFSSCYSLGLPKVQYDCASVKTDTRGIWYIVWLYCTNRLWFRVSEFEFKISIIVFPYNLFFSIYNIWIVLTTTPTTAFNFS